jgi:hypothetical protein
MAGKIWGAGRSIPTVPPGTSTRGGKRARSGHRHRQLTDEALQKLRLGLDGLARVHPNGYLGAMAEHGFACPVLAQISDELRSTVFGRVVDALR